eukprot:CAMPEP_0113844148 /NCGR_PEP_ID=MMETSP0372-20130328/91_1 /TAXON_ID=340204 /ORGANISM="Lankesteria abbotti" /LENGTH=206 /DNA_ID=CAMNT_0000813149 /DNA_START=273 /DNA_END=890 /DNA_ORIENTATION=+ /assembly_acc=CAM_ASM_000359
MALSPQHQPQQHQPQQLQQQQQQQQQLQQHQSQQLQQQPPIQQEVINAPPLQQQIINSPPLYFANRNNNPELFQSAPVQPYLPPGPGPTQAVHPTPTTTSPKGYGLPQHQDNRQYATQNSAPLGQVSPGMSLKYSQSFQGNQMYPVGRLAPQSSGELNQHAGLVGMTKNNLTTSVQGAAANRTFHLNSPTSRSPSRHMRVSYIDSW